MKHQPEEKTSNNFYVFVQQKRNLFNLSSGFALAC